MCSAFAKAQEVHVATANLDRLKYKTGVVILYYGTNRVVSYCNLWDVKFKKEDSEERIGNLLKDKVAAYDPYMYFEFKEGFDCNTAMGYLQKKGISKMVISGCTFIDFSENANGKFNTEGILGFKPKTEENNVLINIPTYSWKLVNNILKKRVSELELDGWRKVYTRYDLAGGPDENLWVGKRISASPDSMYKAIGTVMNSSFKLKAINADIVDADGNPNFVFEADFPGDSLAETNTYIPNEQLKRLIFAGVSNDRVNTNNAGIVVFSKKYSFQNDFQSILDDAKNGFTSFIVKETKDPDGVTVFAARKVLGLKKPTIFSKDQKKWTFIQSCDKIDVNAGKIKEEFLKIIDSYVKTGNYLTESGPYNGDMYYRLMDKSNTILFQMVETPKEIQSLFFGEAKKPDPPKENVIKKETEQFIEPNKKYVFHIWSLAKTAFKWRWLETPANDPNVYRQLANETLIINQKATDYTWALAEPTVKISDNYEYAALVSMVEQGHSDNGQGVIIQYKNGKKGLPSYLFFIINPIKQTYWFGSNNPNNNEWKTHNKFTGNVYNIYSSVINKFTQGIADNKIAVQKNGDKFSLYINNQLIEEVTITKANDELKNFVGIGIVTNHKQKSAIKQVSFSAN